jgi:hypothetical protein
MSTVAPPAPAAGPSPTADTPERRNDRWPLLVVWAVTAALAVVGVAHVLLNARNIPMAEDWHLARPLGRAEPGFWDWVWSQNNEHRLPVARLIYLGLVEVTRDFRAGAVFDTLLMAAVAAALVVLARRLRGRTSVVDAAFPVLLLHPGNWENLVWSWQMQFVVVGAMALVLLVALAAPGETPSPLATWVAAAMLALLPLGGGTALPLVPFAIVAVLARTFVPGSERWARRVAVGASVLAVVGTGLYFVGWEAATWYPDNPGPPETIETAGKLLALAWGPAAAGRYVLVALLTAAVLGPAVVLVVQAVRRPGPQRATALALGAFLAGVLATACAVAYGRAALVPTEGLADRYVITTVPALIAAWLIVQRLGTPPVRRVVHGLVLVGAVALLPLNWRQGYEWRDWYAGEMRAVERDIEAGVTPEELARRHGDFLMHWDEEELVARIEVLRRTGVGPIADVRSP